jgi:hypothetical protein
VPPITGTLAPSPPPIDWSLLTPGHKKFCGPKVVGGYAVAVATCSPYTECGTGKLTSTAFGSTGNDCPKNFMCFDEIECSPPSVSPTDSPTLKPTQSNMPTVTSTNRPSNSPTSSGMPTPIGQTKAPTMKPTISAEPTGGEYSGPPFNVQNSITTRGSYCATSFDVAVSNCSPKIECNKDEDCTRDGETCHGMISCTYAASEEEGHSTYIAGDDDDVYAKEFNDDGDDDFTPAWDTTSSGGRRSTLVTKACLSWMSGVAFVLVGWLA